MEKYGLGGHDLVYLFSLIRTHLTTFEITLAMPITLTFTTRRVGSFTSHGFTMV